MSDEDRPVFDPADFQDAEAFGRAVVIEMALYGDVHIVDRNVDDR